MPSRRAGARGAARVAPAARAPAARAALVGDSQFPVACSSTIFASGAGTNMSRRTSRRRRAPRQRPLPFDASSSRTTTLGSASTTPRRGLCTRSWSRCLGWCGGRCNVRGAGARQIQGRSARSSTAAAPGLPRALPDFPTPRRPLPRGSASSSACYGVPFGLAKVVKVTPPRRPAGGVLYSETDTTAAKSPFPPRAREPRRVAAASVFDVGAPVEAGPPPPPLAEGVVAAAGPTEFRRREAGGGTGVAPGRVPSG